MSRFVRPDTATLTLANGDTLLVRKRLSHGDQTQAFKRLYVATDDGTLKANPLETGMATVTAYLLDWHLAEDPDVTIKGVSVDELTAALNNLSPEDFAEIRDAIIKHENKMADERADAKKKTTGTRVSDPISPLPSEPAGPSSRSVN